MSHEADDCSDAVAAVAQDLSRREVLRTLAGLGLGTAVFHRALAAQTETAAAVTPEMIAQAEWIAGIELTAAQRDETAAALQKALDGWRQLRSVPLPYGVAPAIEFRTLRHGDAPADRIERRAGLPDTPMVKPDSDADLAFLPVARLARLIRQRHVSSRELTRLYLDRLRQFDPALLCVVEYAEELALRQAEAADRELESGQDRGPLHGIPWGVKDLFDVRGLPSAWGAPQFRDQIAASNATIVDRLEQAGAVLLAKLSVGALAWGDDWYGGVTRNPWNQKEGSSGSSAGSASATAAGLLAFAIGSETLGSIVSPCTRCGVTGLRPTFGRISRHGCMALAWSMDKAGPIARTVEDCALVLAAIHGADGLDRAAVDRPFVWPCPCPISQIRVGYVESERGGAAQRDDLRVLKELGCQLVPIELPRDLPVNALTMILNVEAATVFDELTRSGNTAGLNRWPPVFRRSKFVPAVEYLRANRIRTLLMRRMEELFQQVDLYVGGDDLSITNLTGHPTVVMPFGFVEREGVRVPDSITFTGRLFGEAELMAVAHAFQVARGDHLQRPSLDLLQPLPKA